MLVPWATYSGVTRGLTWQLLRSPQELQAVPEPCAVFCSLQQGAAALSRPGQRWPPPAALIPALPVSRRAWSLSPRFLMGDVTFS